MAVNLKVLLIEDSPDDAELLEFELVRGDFRPDVHRVETAEDMRRALAASTWDLVLSDFELPSFSAGGALDVLKESGIDIPFIIVSGMVQAEEAVTLLKRGAHDFLNKNALARLLPAIDREIREAKEREQRRRAEETVRILSLAVQQSPVSVVITDCVGVINYVNPKFEEVTGYSAEQAQGRNLDFTLLDQSAAQSFQSLWNSGLQGTAWRGEFCNLRSDGQIFWEHATVSPIKDEDGSITHFVAVKEDITVRRSYEERLLRQANFDDLTGLPNRVLMRDRLDQAVALSHRHNSQSALLYIDLDRFKTVNDTLGHAVGDMLLVEAALRLGACVREGETLARMGGDEFVIILPDLAAGGDISQKVAERALQAFSQPFVLQGHELFITPSIGITLFPEDGADAEVLLRNADLAMYRAKDMGRNSYSFFTPEINESMQRRLAVEGRLRGAILRDEFRLHYQPIVDLALDQVIGFEALVRWCQDGEIVMPVHFIQVAEEMGLINQIGEWVLETACRQIRSASIEAGRDYRIAVNVSPRQLQIPDLGVKVRNILTAYDMPPECLELEITESVLLDDTADTHANLTMLCEMGVRLSIDDFGTGYSALGYLQRYPFDTLKIDRSFVDVAVDNLNAARLVDTIIAMARGLGLKVIAEGIETQAQLDFLKARRCDMGQGFLLGRPAPLSSCNAAAARIAAGADA